MISMQFSLGVTSVEHPGKRGSANSAPIKLDGWVGVERRVKLVAWHLAPWLLTSLAAGMKYPLIRRCTILYTESK